MKAEKKTTNLVRGIMIKCLKEHPYIPLLQIM